MGKKPVQPRLDEVFLVQNRNFINVGSAYSTGRPSRLGEADAWHIPGKLKPEQEAVVEKFAKQLLDYLGKPGDTVKNDMQARVRDILRLVVVASERAEKEPNGVADVEVGGK